MQIFLKKLKLLFVPVIFVAVSFCGLYTLLNWLLIIKLELITLNNTYTHFGGPALLSIIPILVWLKPRLKLITLKSKRIEFPDLTYLVLWAAVAAPTIIAQEYLETATGSLTELRSITDINKQPKTKYYTLKKFYFDKAHAGVATEFDVSGKYNEHFNMQLLVVVPIVNEAADTTRKKCAAWYGITYSKTISNNLSQDEKEAAYKDFLQTSQQEFDQANFSNFIYLSRVTTEENSKGYNKAITQNSFYAKNNRIILEPKDERFEERNGSKLYWIFGSFGIASGIFIIILSLAKFNNRELKKLQTPAEQRKMNSHANFNVKKALKSFMQLPVSNTLLALNILVFIVMVFSGLGFASFQTDDLLRWGANYKPSVLDGQWWRLLTSMFLHGGIMHLFGNIYGLFFVGIFLERKLNRVKYISLYFITGLIASVTSLLWHEASVGVGASGAIFGLYGIFLAFLLKKVYPPAENKAILTNTLVYIGINLLFGLAGNIDNAAHIGGLLSGFVFGLIIQPLNKHKDEERQKQPVEEAQHTHDHA